MADNRAPHAAARGCSAGATAGALGCAATSWANEGMEALHAVERRGDACPPCLAVRACVPWYCSGLKIRGRAASASSTVAVTVPSRNCTITSAPLPEESDTVVTRDRARSSSLTGDATPPQSRARRVACVHPRTGGGRGVVADRDCTVRAHHWLMAIARPTAAIGAGRRNRDICRARRCPYRSASSSLPLEGVRSPV